MNRKTLDALWTTAVDYRIVDENTPIRCFHHDIDHDGTEKLCIQSGDSLFVLGNAGTVEQAERIVVPLGDVGEESQPSRLEATGSVLRLVCGQTTRWRHDMAKRRFGVGLGRDKWDDLEWDSDFRGFYREQTVIVALALADCDGDGQDEIVVLASNGRLHVLARDGRVICKQRLPRGSISEAEIFPVGEPGDGAKRMLAVSVEYRQKRKRFFWYDSREDYTFLLRQGAVAAKAKDVRILCPLCTREGSLLSHRLERVEVTGKREIRAGHDQATAQARLDESHTVARNPWDQTDNLILRSDPSSRRLTVCTVAGDELWETGLPATEGRSYEVRAALGPRDPNREQLLAVWFVTGRTLPDVKAEVFEEHLHAYSLTGELLAAKDFPPNGESRIRRGPLLVVDRSPEGNGARIVAIDTDIVSVYGFDSPRADTAQPAAAGAFADMPEFDLPPLDLWSRSILADDPASDCGEEP